MSEVSGDNPYFGRKGYLEAHGRYVTAARQWRAVSMLALVVAGISTTGMVLLGTQAQVVPYVVRVDKLGEALPVARADIAVPPDKTIIVAQLAHWITAVRTVWSDAGAQRSLVRDAYALINAHGSAYGTLNDYMRGNDPFERAKSETVAVEVLSVLPISSDSWRVEWREEGRARDGVRTATREYQATVAISFSPPRDEATIRINPVGLYINSFSWAERLATRQEGKQP